jgi:hypothetical protein
MARVALPEIAQHVIIFGDNGAAGRAAAAQPPLAVLRTGRTVELCCPPTELGDWNDVLQHRAKKP